MSFTPAFAAPRVAPRQNCQVVNKSKSDDAWYKSLLCTLSMGCLLYGWWEVRAQEYLYHRCYFRAAARIPPYALSNRLHQEQTPPGTGVDSTPPTHEVRQQEDSSNGLSTQPVLPDLTCARCRRSSRPTHRGANPHQYRLPV